MRAETARLWDIRRMRKIVRTMLAGVVALGLAGTAQASEWGGIAPGVTTLEQVRERYGAPSKESKTKLENYDITTLTYEGSRAPAGMNRLVVEVGWLAKDGFKPNVVRVFRLEPRPLIFPIQAIMDGWGIPSAAGESGGRPTFFYEEGLVVIFDPQGVNAENMSFTLPQAIPPSAFKGGPAGQPGQPPAAAAPRGAGPRASLSRRDGHLHHGCGVAAAASGGPGRPGRAQGDPDLSRARRGRPERAPFPGRVRADAHSQHRAARAHAHGRLPEHARRIGS